MEAQELARAKLSVAETRRQASARRARESRLSGSAGARKAVAQDFAAVNDTEAHRARRPS